MIRKIIQAILISAAIFTVPVLAAQQPEFSADVITQADGQTMSGKMFVSKDKMRFEMPEAITISRLDRKVSYVLMPSEKMYMEHPIDRLAAAKTAVQSEGEVDRVAMGKETIDGKDTDKFRVTYKDGQGTTTVFQWIDSNGIPVKVASEDGKWSVEYKNISANPQPESLFEVPSDYQSMAIPNMASMYQGTNTSSVQDMIEKAKKDAENAVGDSEKGN